MGQAPRVEACTFRIATDPDAEAVARLHAESWRRHYRGAYSDAFLDGDVLSDRLSVWSDRLNVPSETTRTFVAELDGVPVGFAHVVLDADPILGALLDNLHVDVANQRSGIGSALMARSGRFVAEARPASGLYLWVLEQNTAAQAFYRAIGGEPADSAPVETVGGVEGRLNGTPTKVRYTWAEPSVLETSDLRRSLRS